MFNNFLLSLPKRSKNQKCSEDQIGTGVYCHLTLATVLWESFHRKRETSPRAPTKTVYWESTSPVTQILLPCFETGGQRFFSSIHVLTPNIFLILQRLKYISTISASEHVHNALACIFRIIKYNTIKQNKFTFQAYPHSFMSLDNVILTTQRIYSATG